MEAGMERSLLSQARDRALHITDWLEACHQEYAKAYPNSSFGRLHVDMSNMIRRMAAVEVLLEDLLNAPGALIDDGVEGGQTKDLKDMELSSRPYNTLRIYGAETSRDVAELDPKQILRARNMGRKSFRELIVVMEELGFTEWARRADQELRY